MESILERREKNMGSLALEFVTHPDFAEARADALLWDVTQLEIRTIDKTRIGKFLGVLNPVDLAAVEDGVRRVHGL